jgi:hypothetical protein
MTRAKSAIGMLLFLIFASTAWGAIPRLVNYQGLLRTAGGALVPDGSYSVKFSIYSVPTGGTELWTETKTIVTSNGLFSTLLGSVSPIPDSAFGSASSYIGIEVSTDPEMSPRQQLASVPYANRVGTVEGVSGPVNVDTTSDTALGIALSSNVNDAAVNCPSPVTTTTVPVHSNWFGIPIYSPAYGQSRTCYVAVANAAGLWSVLFQGWSGNVYALGKATFGPLHANNGDYSFIAGCHNRVDYGADQAAIAGGRDNVVSGLGDFGSIGGGQTNHVSAAWATVAGGDTCVATSNYASVGGGYLNRAGGVSSTISGGYYNSASNTQATVGGGASNAASGELSTISGGGSNSATAPGATIGGGLNNYSHGNNSAVGGGHRNHAYAEISTISGGDTNVVQYSGAGGVIGGGDTNVVSDSGGSVLGGSHNLASGGWATVGGGAHNSATERYSTVPGGYLNQATKYSSFAAGQQAQANNQGTFVWSDNSAGPFASLKDNSFIIRATGGVGIGTPNPTVALHVVGSICYTGTCGTCSDVRYKKNVATLTGALQRVLRMHGVIYNWRTDKFPQMKFSEEPQVGFIAQELEDILPEVVSRGSDGFYSVDYGRLTPVLVGAMQEQQAMILAQQATIEKLQKKIAEIDELKSQVAEMSSQVTRLLDAQSKTAKEANLAVNDYVDQTGGK